MSSSGWKSPRALERRHQASFCSSAASSGGSVLLADKCHFTSESTAVPLLHRYTLRPTLAATTGTPQIPHKPAPFEHGVKVGTFLSTLTDVERNRRDRSAPPECSGPTDRQG